MNNRNVCTTFNMLLVPAPLPARLHSSTWAWAVSRAGETGSRVRSSGTQRRPRWATQHAVFLGGEHSFSLQTAGGI